MKRSVRLAAVAVLFCAGLAQAEEPPAGPPKPGPEHKKLEFFVGTWSGKAEIKESPMGPGGPMTWTETCEWFPGGFAVVCRSEGKGPMGPVNGLGILGYNGQENAYTYYGVDSGGWSGLAKGTIAGPIWTFTSDEQMGDKVVRGRYTLKQVSADRQTFTYEASVDGGPWNTVMEGGSDRKK